MRDVLTAMVKCYEVHGMLAMHNDMAGLGYDNVVLTKVAAAATAVCLLGGGQREIVSAVSNAWADGAALKAYRHGTNSGERKNWAAGDATSRGVMLALMAMKGERGYATVLTAKKYGFYDAVFGGKSFEFSREHGTYVIQNVIYKMVPAGLHGQSAAECAIRLHPMVKERLGEIQSITIHSHKKLMAMMDRKGPLLTPAARDHCVQYVIALGLIFGGIGTADYEDDFAADPRIDRLRETMTVIEEPRYSADRLDPNKRSNAIAIDIAFKDGSSLPRVHVEYPPGHPRRRAESMPVLEAKFQRHVARCFAGERQSAILEHVLDQQRLEALAVDEFMNLFAP
jgi:2-methylcitrate dehydratase